MKNTQKLRTKWTGSIWEPFFFRIKGLPVFRDYRRFSKDQWAGRKAYEARLQMQLAAILRHAVFNIPFYRELSKTYSEKDILNHPFSVLKEFPVLEKSDLLENSSKLRWKAKRKAFKNQTGGSTGVPVSFFQDRPYQSANLASAYLMFEWAGILPGLPKVKLWGAKKDIPGEGGGFKYHFGDLMGNRTLLNCFVLTPEIAEAYVRVINRFKPAVIEAYADSLYDFCQIVKNNNLPLTHWPLSVVTSASPLFNHMRTRIEEVFKAPVFNRYGSRECGGIAAECDRHVGLHVMGETTVLEIVSHQGRTPLPPGEEGDIVITNLFNYTMPFIRYRIGDTGRINPGSCACGRPYPLLEEISGRISSNFKRKDGATISHYYFSMFFYILHNDGQIRKFQIIQKTHDYFIIRIVPHEGFGLERWPKRAMLEEYIRKIMGASCRIEFSIEKEIAKTPSGKHLYSLCEIE